jgi:hypothetical protein
VLLDSACGGAGVAKHLSNDVAVQHTLNRYSVNTRTNTCHVIDSIDEGIAVVRPCAANQRTVDVEEYYSTAAGLTHVAIIASLTDPDMLFTTAKDGLE